MRTGASLFNDEPAVTEQAPGTVRKGRNAELISRRDQLLVHRYAYYIVYTELRPEAVNNRLEDEFWLTERHFLTIIYDHAAEIKEFKRTPLTIVQLRNLYPHLVWIATK